MIEFIRCENNEDIELVRVLLINKGLLGGKGKQIGQFIFSMNETNHTYEIVITTRTHSKVGRCIFAKSYYDKVMVPSLTRHIAG